jgi:hypothetical protein
MNKRKWKVYTTDELRDRFTAKPGQGVPVGANGEDPSQKVVVPNLKRRNSAPPGMIHFPPGTFSANNPQNNNAGLLPPHNRTYPLHIPYRDATIHKETWCCSKIKNKGNKIKRRKKREKKKEDATIHKETWCCSKIKNKGNKIKRRKKREKKKEKKREKRRNKKKEINNNNK